MKFPDAPHSLKWPVEKIQKEFMEIDNKLHPQEWVTQQVIENLGFKLKLI